jgi:hypothetical protein
MKGRHRTDGNAGSRAQSGACVAARRCIASSTLRSPWPPLTGRAVRRGARIIDADPVEAGRHRVLGRHRSDGNAGSRAPSGAGVAARRCIASSTLRSPWRPLTGRAVRRGARILEADRLEADRNHVLGRQGSGVMAAAAGPERSGATARRYLASSMLRSRWPPLTRPCCSAQCRGPQG